MPQDLYEAAKVDGEGAVWRCRSVTILVFLVAPPILSSFQAFDIIPVMTHGRPVESTGTLIWHIDDEGSGHVANGGRFSAASVLRFRELLGFTLLLLALITFDPTPPTSSGRAPASAVVAEH